MYKKKASWFVPYIVSFVFVNPATADVDAIWSGMPSSTDTAWLQGANSEVTSGNSASNNGVAKVGYVNPVKLGGGWNGSARYSFTVDGRPSPSYLSTLGFIAQCRSDSDTTYATLTCNGKKLYRMAESPDYGSHGDAVECRDLAIPTTKVDLGASRISCELKLENVEYSKLPALQVMVMDRLFN